MELNCDAPRLVKSNLIYYKINKIFAGVTTSALITDNGELLIQGMNDVG